MPVAIKHTQNNNNNSNKSGGTATTDCDNFEIYCEPPLQTVTVCTVCVLRRVRNLAKRCISWQKLKLASNSRRRRAPSLPPPTLPLRKLFMTLSTQTMHTVARQTSWPAMPTMEHKFGWLYLRYEGDAYQCYLGYAYSAVFVELNRRGQISLGPANWSIAKRSFLTKRGR